MVGYGGVFSFEFKLEGTENLPNIEFIYLQPFNPNDIYYTMSVTVEVEK